MLSSEANVLREGVKAELFRGHSAAVLLLGFILNCQDMITVDSEGRVIVWKYTRSVLIMMMMMMTMMMMMVMMMMMMIMMITMIMITSDYDYDLWSIMIDYYDYDYDYDYQYFDATVICATQLSA